MSFVSKIFGNSNSRFLKNLGSKIQAINALEKEFEKFSDTDLKEKTGMFKERLRQGETLDDILEEAFALVREAAKRTLKQRHFDVQLMGGIALHQGKITEMKTGEGKTLVATLPAYLNALAGSGVHIVTVNDYLSRRDTVWMGQIYHFLGLRVGCLNHEASYLYDPLHTEKNQVQENEISNSQFSISNKISNPKSQNDLDKIRDTLGSFKVVHEFLRPSTRKEAYDADITYGTNNEFGFDYLKDNMVYPVRNEISNGAYDIPIVQRGYHFAIVDEIDSILIDEAGTPLIISAPDMESEELYVTFSHIIPHLEENRDYTIDEKMRAVSITEEGIEKVEKMLGIKDIYTEKGIKYVHHLEQALKAQALFHRDKNYVVKNGEVIIVDEFTGRLMPGRRWSEGLHQAIEAKEGVQVQKESRTLASITFQNYFRMYEKLSGMTGTALTSAEEFHKVYDLEVAVIPTNKPMIRKDLSDLVYQTENGKFQAIIGQIKNLHETGQPVLVGTVSIEKNEHLSALLKKEGITHRVLNAKHHEEEGEIIAQAGRKGAVTIATNMAGRGVDIVLAGNPPDTREAEEIKKLGGLYVIGSQRHEARRIDNQLRGRSGRQGDPGKTRFYVSFEDDLMRIFGSDRIKKMMGTFGIPEDQPIENKFVSRAIESAQSKIEGLNFDARKHVLEYDDVMNSQRNKIYRWRREILLGDEKTFGKIIREMFEKTGNDLDLFEKKQKESGDEKAYLYGQRIILLRIIDMLWIEHLETMEYMRSSVGLRAYGQRDPLVEYKNEGSRLFKALETAIRGYYIQLALGVQIEQNPKSQIPNPKQIQNPNDQSNKKFGNWKLEIGNSRPKVGRNDPCWCGSGKKYKRCHGM
jgi:preprotein translocase subunit SecA